MKHVDEVPFVPPYGVNPETWQATMDPRRLGENWFDLKGAVDKSNEHEREERLRLNSLPCARGLMHFMEGPTIKLEEVSVMRCFQ